MRTHVRWGCLPSWPSVLAMAPARCTGRLRLHALIRRTGSCCTPPRGSTRRRLTRPTQEALERLALLAADPLCIAVGEIGLDYYHLDNPDIPTQQAAFRAQMAIAAAVGKPILLHCRTSELAVPAAKVKYGSADAAEDLLTLLETDWAPSGPPCVLHCFSGTPEQAGRRFGFRGLPFLRGESYLPQVQPDPAGCGAGSGGPHSGGDGCSLPDADTVAWTTQRASQRGAYSRVSGATAGSLG